MKSSHYVASVGKDDKERLSIQHESFSKGTNEFLARLNIAEGMSVLVVGCGGGDETAMIAKRVGNTGKVTAIDISPEQIGIAQELITKEKLTNVTLSVLPAEKLPEINEKFDVSYCRMVLVHISDPKKVLQLMSDRTKDNGIIACEEPDISSCFSIPESPSFSKHIKLLCEFMKRRSCDPDLGSKLYKIFREIGFSNIHMNFFQPAITNKRLQLAAPLSANSCKEQYISLGLLTETEADEMIEQIKKELVEREDSLLGQCRMTQIYGMK
jgi:ubiquinone/menaquinone biosynthesis C-methylase UbiE